MKYTKFTIKKYRGIINPLVLNIKENSPIALVGLNESGKSTIIDAIFAFDYLNDEFNSKYNQLNKVQNLYARPNERENAKIEARIICEAETDFAELLAICKSISCINNYSETPESSSSSPRKYEDELVIGELKRNFSTFEIQREIEKEDKAIYILNKEIESEILNIAAIKSREQEFCKKIIDLLPTMIYVKEFDKFVYEIPTTNTSLTAEHKEYKKLFDNLFLTATQNEVSFDSFFKLTETSDSAPYLKDITKYLNKVFTERWKKFSIEHNFSDLALDINLTQPGKMKIEVSEVVDGKPYTFDLYNRSSGFIWYFNFIMRTLFNPKHKNAKNDKILYLMDEPGTFLHESSQKSLAQELKSIISDNFLIYTTHHFQMIHLKNISLGNIYIVEKHKKLVSAYKTTAYQGYNDESKKSSFLPILHTLRFSFLDLLREEGTKNKKFLLVEGLHDMYFIKLFIQNTTVLKDVIVCPSVGADQILANLPEFMFYNNGVYALFDNDEKGVKAKNNFVKNVSTKLKKNAFVLPFLGYEENISDSFTMNDMFDQTDLTSIYNSLIEANVEVFDNSYKNIMEALYNNQERVPTLSLSNESKEKIEKLKDFLVTKFK